MPKVDEAVLLQAPPGRWRVVEFSRADGEQIEEAVRALRDGLISGEEGDRIAQGKLLRVVGDYTSYSVASDVVCEARYPASRRLYNDLGIDVFGYEPGRASAPNAGSES